MRIAAIDPMDTRTFELNVAGPAALLVAKLHKIGERQHVPGRLVDKDAHDIYRLLVAIDTHSLAQTLGNLRAHHFCGPVTQEALTLLSHLFAAGPHAPGSHMAGRAEELVGDPAVVSASAALLANDLLAQLA